VSGLESLATERGILALLALDHRDALRNAFARAGVDAVDEETMLAAKGRIAAALAPHVSGILLDEASAKLAAPPGLPVVLPLEEQGHETLEGGRVNRLMRLPATECAAHKLLLYYRADHDASASRQRALAEQAAAIARAAGVPLVLEPLVYRLDGEDETAYGSRFGELVAAAAADLAGSGAAVLKLQFPGDDCSALTDASTPLPWALLGGSDVDGETFARQLEVACDAGGSGFIAGRAIWGGALGLDGDDADAWLAGQAAPLLARLRRTADLRGRPI
jgi:tagatose-1,6-bisphosphate aldolase